MMQIQETRTLVRFQMLTSVSLMRIQEQKLSVMTLVRISLLRQLSLLVRSIETQESGSSTLSEVDSQADLQHFVETLELMFKS